MFPSEQYDVGSVVLDRGDIAVLYTDGITESRNEDNKEFNERRFIKLVKENSECSAKELLDKIFKEIDLFTQVTEQMDDMTLVVIKREGRSVRP
jgi:serine phosphatase RsbU (regulator of sigma subunit)